MAAYAATVHLKTGYSTVLHYFDATLPPAELDMCVRVYKELKSFQDFLGRLDSRSRKRMSASLERIAGVLDESINRALNADSDDEFLEFSRSLLETLKKMKEELLEDEEEAISSSSSSSSSSKMIGLCDELSKLKDALFNRILVEETVFLLAGMAGIGKTALAWEVYQDSDISEWFECRAWVSVGLGRKLDELALDILSQVDPEAHKMIMGGSVDEMGEVLKESLKGRRYLIVLDDVWDFVDFLDYMKSVLCHGTEGSRIVLTSRIKDSSADYGWHLIEKQLLNKEKSWDLLREKVFAGGSCPPELEDSGKKIAVKCDGLPLTILTVAELLSKTNKSLWINVAEKKKHQVFIDAYDQISKVLYPSYKELNDGFKLCFLYMGLFPLKCEIDRYKLINLWSVEKIFDQFKEGVSPYVTFLNLIMHLDGHSLVMVYQRSASSSLILPTSLQTIRLCGLHSSWWHFCQREAKKINFFHVLDCPEDALEVGIKGQSRLSIHNNVLFARKDVFNSIEENCATTAQTLLCFGPYHQYMVPLCFGLKFLLRLDALNIRFYDFPLEVLKLSLLVYLSLTCNRQIPPSISKLEKLQYLILHPHLSIKSCGVLSYMPVEIWDLKELKHLEVLGSDLPDPGDKSLDMLSTLLDVSTTTCSVFNKLPNLEKMRIRIVLTPEAPDPLCFFDHISNLKKIESLTCIVVNPVFMFPVVSPVASFPFLPSTLTKLHLNGLGYPWKEMREIASLRSLKVLELQCNAFHGQIWEVENGDFLNLQFLLIEDLDLVKLKGGPVSFGRLRHLSIKHCYKFEKIKSGVCRGVSTIEVVDSNPLVEKSIKKAIYKIGKRPKNLSVHCSWKSE